jgi:hypothetical protein
VAAGGVRGCGVCLCVCLICVGLVGCVQYVWGWLGLCRWADDMTQGARKDGLCAAVGAQKLGC